MQATTFNTILKEHSTNIYRYIYKCIRNKEEAQDITQEAFTRLWEHRDRIDTTKAKSWLYTTAHRLMLERVSARKLYTELESNSDTPQGGFSINNNSWNLKEILDWSLTQVSGIQRELILLRDLEGYSYEEIGSILDMNQALVKVNLFRARQKLQQVIRQHYPEYAYEKK